LDLHFNSDAHFTRWVVRQGHLAEPFVVIDVGVQGGEHVRWHVLGDYLLVHGFDALEEAVETLRRQNAGNPNRHYHSIAIGDVDGDKTFYFREDNPFSSSFLEQGEDRFSIGRRIERPRRVSVRQLDTLLAEGVIPKPDFLKADVEGFENKVFLGARQVLKLLLGIETETSFGASHLYPKNHFISILGIALENKLLAFDLNFNRIPRASFRRAISRKDLSVGATEIGQIATLNVLFCRDLISEADYSRKDATRSRVDDIDQIIKQMIIYELHGLNDVALDTAEHYAHQLGSRLDVEEAIQLLADPYCREPEGKRGAMRAAEIASQREREREAFVARITELLETGQAEREAFVARITELLETGQAERGAFVARITELLETSHAEREASVARITELLAERKG
jgi:FkbM family methyltransferase